MILNKKEGPSSKIDWASYLSGAGKSGIVLVQDKFAKRELNEFQI